MDLTFVPAHIYYHNLTVRFYPQKDIRMNTWIGAVFRNDFLHAARAVKNPQGQTLYDLLSQLPLPDSHPYYKQLCGGFPKGFVWDISGIPHTHKDFTLERGHIYTATFRLIGRMTEYTVPCCMAIERFCERGFGHPFVPLHLMDICETGEQKDSLLYNDATGFLSTMPDSPCLMKALPNDTEPATIELRTLTPVCLMKLRNSGTDSGYQEKLNGFPSLYQWIRTSAYRLYYLSMLYGKDFTPIDHTELDAGIENYLLKTREAFLIHAGLHYRKLHSTPKKELNGQVYGMDGYEGTLTFKNVHAAYLPLLRFMSHLGVGNDINYGLGLYDIINRKTYK